MPSAMQNPHSVELVECVRHRHCRAIVVMDEGVKVLSHFSIELQALDLFEYCQDWQRAINLKVVTQHNRLTNMFQTSMFCVSDVVIFCSKHHP